MDFEIISWVYTHLENLMNMLVRVLISNHFQPKLVILGSIQSIEWLFGWFDEKSPRTLEIKNLGIYEIDVYSLL